MHSHGLAIEFCPSNRLSVKRVLFDKTKEISAHIFIPYDRSIMLVYRQEKRLVGRPLVLEILDQIDPFLAKSRFSLDIRS